jgi:hypothetical protein
VGLNFESRTLREPNTVQKFTASNALFSHVQIGIPLRPNWGLSFGLRPMSRVSYKMLQGKRLTDPNTGLPIDSSSTLHQGDGGSYLASLGTGFRIKLSEGNYLGFGVNGGYLFGKKDISSRIGIINDSLSYNAGNFQTRTTYGNLYANLGVQYQAKLKSDLYLTVGAYGNWEQKLKARQDIIRETYFYDENNGYVRLDSVMDQKDIRGTITYPSSYTAGFVLEKVGSATTAGWLVGVDYSTTKWDNYRFYGKADSTVKTKSEIRIGAQFRPVPKGNYFSNVAYRLGFFAGNDYIYLNQKLPQFGATLGFGFPLRNFNRTNNQATVINLALEYIKRGNNDNLLKENLFRVSFGFSLSDLWYLKKKYD